MPPVTSITSLADATRAALFGAYWPVDDGAGATRRVSLDQFRDVSGVDLFNVKVGASGLRAAGDGVADETAAFQAVIDAAAGQRVIVPGGTYRLDNALAAADDFHLLLAPDAVLRPRSASQMFTRTAQAPSVSVTVTAGATTGSRSVTVASTVGLTVGATVRFHTSLGPRPWNWNTIKGIAGAAVDLESPLSITYGGTVTMDVQPLYGRATIEGGRIDLSQITGASTGVIALAGYQSVQVRGVRFVGPNSSATVVELVTLTGNRFASIEDCTAEDVTCYGGAFAVIGSRIGRISRCEVDGNLFGTLTSACDFSMQESITYRGRRGTTGVPNYSIRAVKSQYDRHFMIRGVQASECETVIEAVDVGRGLIADVQGVNIGLGSFVGQTAINIASSSADGELNTISLSGVNLENLGGIGIQVSGDITGRIILDRFQLKNVVSAALQLAAVDLVIGTGTIENWDTGGYASALGAGVVSTATSSLGSIDLSHITFIHSDATKRCFALKAGPAYNRVGIHTPTLNPLDDTTDGVDLGAVHRFAGSIAAVTKSGSVAQVGHVGAQPVGFSVTNGQTFSFVVGTFGKLVAITLGGGQGALVFADVNGVVIVSDPSTTFVASAAPGAGKVGVHKTGNNQINVTSNFGSTINVRLCVLGSGVTSTTDPA